MIIKKIIPLLLLIFLALPLTSAVVLENGTFIQTTGTGYNFSVVTNSTLEQLNVTSTQIIIKNPVDMVLQNVNGSNGILDFIDMVNALIYFGNLTLVGSTDINSNDGSLSLTVPPNNSTFILGHFNLTENVNRPNSPLLFTSSTDIVKNISSNASSTINATVIFDVRNCFIKEINYTSESGFNYQPSFSCSDSQVTVIGLRQIENSVGLNVIDIIYKNCSSSTRSVLNAMLIFLALAIAISGYVLVDQFIKTGQVTLKQFLITFIIIVTFVALIGVVSNLVSAACGVA